MHEDNEEAPREMRLGQYRWISHISAQFVSNPQTDEFAGIKSAVIESAFSFS